jgi:hypothetical protein
MSASKNHEAVAEITRRGPVLAALLATALAGASISRAQTGATPAAVPAVKAAATAAKPLVPQAEESPSKGSHEGIKVHGHWTIEVKNADGTVASHSEFENAIVNGYGQDVITGTLSGEYVSGGFFISLNGSVGTGSGDGLCGNFGNCTLTDSRNTTICPPANSPGVCGHLTYTPNPTPGPGFSTVGYTLAGTIPPSNAGTITSVASGVTICAVSPNLYGSAPAESSATASTTPSQFTPQACFTGGTTGAGEYEYPFTQTNTPSPKL